MFFLLVACILYTLCNRNSICYRYTSISII